MKMTVYLAESLCKKIREAIVEKWGIIEGVSDRPYVTNSHHVPVFFKCDPFFKTDIEADYSTLATGGNIFHIEVDTTNTNLEALTHVVEYALSKDIPYIRLSHKTSTCRDCGYTLDTAMYQCEKCGSENIEILATITGYLTKELERCNSAKQAEIMDRIVHE